MEPTMNKDTLQNLIQRIETGEEPTVILHAKNTRDTTTVKFFAYSAHVFHGTTVDKHPRPIQIRENTLLHGNYNISFR